MLRICDFADVNDLHCLSLVKNVWVYDNTLSCFLSYSTFVSQVVTGYLPNLILQLFLSLVPPIMIIFSSMQGYISFSEIQKSACTKMLWFTVWNIFFANVLSGSVLYQVNIILEPKEIPKILAEVVPAQVKINFHY